MSPQSGKCLAVIRIRGRSEVQKPVTKTLKMLNLTRANHASLIIENPSVTGMLQKVKDYTTWGEPSKDTILLLLKKRAELESGESLTETNVKEKLGYPSLEKLAEALHKTEVGLHKIPGLKPVFRLHPPKHGFKGSKSKPFLAGGETGYRGEAINHLIRRMI